MDQTTLDDLSVSGDDRPDAEAVAVAGEAATHVSEVIDAGDVRVPEPAAETAVDLMVTAVDYTVEGRGSDEYPVVHVFGRTTDNEREHVRVVGVEPYFYVPTADVADRDLVSEYDVILDTREHPHGDPDNDRFESIRGEPVTKITTRTPRDVGQIRDEFATTYEADILFPNRFLIDHGVTAGLRVEPRRIDGDPDEAIQVTPEHLEATDVDADLRVNTFDIEVDDRNGFPENGEEPIVCLTSHDSYRDEYVLWLYDAPDGDGSETTDEELLGAFADYEFISGDADVRLERFETEEAMLDSYLSYINRTDPDVSTGWNCLPEDTDVQMGDGSVKQIKNVEVGDQVVGEDGQSTTTAEVIDRWESHKRILEFQLADGTTLRSSEDHRVMVGDETDVSWTEAGEVAVGDYVLKPRKLRVEDPEVPKLRELVPQEFHRFTDPETISEFNSGLPYGAVSELSEEFGVSKETLYHPNTTVWTPDRCAHAAQQFDTAIPDGGVEYRQSGRNLDTELSPHEAYLAGLVLTDGSMSRDNGIRFYNTKPALHEQFDDDPHLEPDGKGCYKQNVLDFSRMWAFNGLGVPFGDKNASEVDLSTVYEMPVRYIAQFLAGVIDGDGSVNDTVTVAAENGTIGEWYVRLFKRLGVYAERNENVVRVPDSERDLSVVRGRILPHMSHPEKTSELNDLVGGESGRSENIPSALFEAPEGTDRRRIGRDKHRRGINLKRHETDNTEWEEFVFVEVDSTTTVGTETTYDLETSTNNFIADDCLVHNCDDFDAPYMFDRMEELNPTTEYDLSPDRASRVDETWRSGWGGPDVKGRVVFDLLYAYQRTKFSELDSYRLDAVAELELGVGKERYTGDIGDLWEDDPTRLLEYNLRDVELCVEIDRQQNLIDFWDDTRKFVGCQLEDAPTPGDVVDMYVLHQAFGEFVLPTKGQQAGEEFEGGAVFEPISGVAENVSVLDLKSLYPMCMVTINASPETIVDDPESYDEETYRAPDGTRFRKEPDGMMREMVDALLTEREQKKTRRDEHDPGTEAYEKFDRQQASIKVIMNSLYGVSGWEQFRLYDKDNAAAITAMGRRVIEFTEEAANEIDYEVTYGDTDSVMLSLSDISTADTEVPEAVREAHPEMSTAELETTQAAIEASEEIESYINGRYDEFASEELGAEEHRFQIEFEKLYRRFFQAGKKKRYAGHIVWKEGKHVDSIDITGFEYTRSDIAPITKRVQQRVIEMIVTGESSDDLKEFLHEEIQSFKAGDVDVDEIGIPGGIGKKLDNYDTDTAQVRGAKYANLLLGTNFQSGSKPKRLYLEKVHPDFFERVEAETDLTPNGPREADALYTEFKRDPDVICYEFADELPPSFEIDYEKMLAKTLKGPIARITESLGLSWDEIESGQEQTGLGQWG